MNKDDPMNDDIERALRSELHASLVPFDAERADTMIYAATHAELLHKRRWAAPLATAAAIATVGGSAALIAANGGGSGVPAGDQPSGPAAPSSDTVRTEYCHTTLPIARSANISDDTVWVCVLGKCATIRAVHAPTITVSAPPDGRESGIVVSLVPAASPVPGVSLAPGRPGDPPVRLRYACVVSVGGAGNGPGKPHSTGSVKVPGTASAPNEPPPLTASVPVAPPTSAPTS